MKELFNQSTKQCGFSIENQIITFYLSDEFVDSYGLLSNYVLFKIKPKVYKTNKLNISARVKHLNVTQFHEENKTDLTFFRSKFEDRLILNKITKSSECHILHVESNCGQKLIIEAK